MRLLVKMLKQQAVYWEPDGVDAFSQEVFKPPVLLKCRWEDDSEQGIDENGNETVFLSTVYVDRDLKVGGRIMLGTFEPLDSPLPPPPETARRIRQFDLIPTLDAKQFLRTARL